MSVIQVLAGIGQPADPYYEYTTLLLPGSGTNGAQNNTFLDGSTNNFTITRNGNTTQGTFSPFSQTGWGGAFNTSTTYLTVTDTANLRFGSSNFTIEAWVYRNASGATQTIASKGASTPTGWVFQISSADKLVFTDTSTSITGTTSIAANTWTYVAVVRAGTGANQTTLYVNGTSDGTGTSATNFNQTSNMLIGADRSTTNFANGYISNLRLSNTNRTISSAPTTTLTADANTIFLSLNLNRFQYTDSTAAYTNISVTGTPSVVAFSPFNPTASWSAATYGGSGYFDGSGDSLSVANNAALSYGTGAFTIEGFFYTSATTQYISIFSDEASGGAVGLTLLLNPTVGNGQLVLYGNGTLLVTATGKYNDNAWHHFAISRDSTNLRLYVDGAYIGASASGSTNFNASQPLYLMTSIIPGRTMSGYLSNFRTIKGTALYTGTSSITVPTAPLTAITNTSLLLNFTNAGIYDATSKNDLETVGNAQISNTTAKWGGTSIKFDGSGDYLTGLTNTALNTFGTSPFTVEAWVYPTATKSSSPILDTLPLNGNGTRASSYSFFISSSNKAGIYTNGISYASSGSISLNTWTHIAFVREGTGTNQTKIYINGVNDGTFTTTTNDTLGGLNVGVTANLPTDINYMFQGYIQDLRVTKGYARYTANFTAPTAPFQTF